MSRERLTELLAGEEVGDLTAAERVELDALVALYPHDAAAGRDALSRVAGALAASAGGTQVPADVLRRMSGGRCPSRWKPFAAGFISAAALAAGLAWGTGKLGSRAGSPAGVESRPRHYRAPNGGAASWDQHRQAGTLEVRDLEPNDPQQSRYQIWIVDAARPEPYRRVDGGLFNAGGDSVVPIRATLPIGEAAAFAITRESPAGAVVSAGPLLAVYTPVEP